MRSIVIIMIIIMTIVKYAISVYVVSQVFENTMVVHELCMFGVYGDHEPIAPHPLEVLSSA